MIIAIIAFCCGYALRANPPKVVQRWLWTRWHNKYRTNKYYRRQYAQLLDEMSSIWAKIHRANSDKEFVTRANICLSNELQAYKAKFGDLNAS